MDEDRKPESQLTRKEHLAIYKGKVPPKGIIPPQFQAFAWKPGESPHHPSQMGMQWKYTHKASRFLYFFSLTANISESCKKAGIKYRHYVYRWMENPEFKKAFDIAKQMGHDAWEDEMARRAFDGFDEPLVYKGEISKELDPESGEMVPVTVKRYSDLAGIFMLKGAKPRKYVEKHQEATGANITVNIALNDTIQKKLHEIYEP